ncbi:hypothetical protein PIB30_084757 [Stylosanthes scabra]|uniref:Uncharacterized protein n=1 Tax=Stylosanthes scabra TaxID=79078 RepID=A0ABU6SSW4_9FABA|nr:hypothetical protein [Stylosanthes scabra]
MGLPRSIVVEFMLQLLRLALEPEIPLVVPRVMWLRINPGKRIGLGYLGEGRDGSYRKRGKQLASRSRKGRRERPTFNFIDRSVAYHSMLEVPEVFIWIGGSVIVHIGHLTNCLCNWTRRTQFGKEVWS